MSILKVAVANDVSQKKGLTWFKDGHIVEVGPEARRRNSAWLGGGLGAVLGGLGGATAGLLYHKPVLAALGGAAGAVGGGKLGYLLGNRTGNVPGIGREATVDDLKKTKFDVPGIGREITLDDLKRLKAALASRSE